MNIENVDFGGLPSLQPDVETITDVIFERKRLVRAIEDAATALPEDELKAALSQGLGNTHLTVIDETEEPMSVLVDADGKPKRGVRSRMTREEVIETLRLSKKQKRVARVLSSLQSVSPISLTPRSDHSDKSDDTL
jgi:hypothetical protein